jgi:hypothetical protein
MPRETVQVTARCVASPEAVWAVVRNFCDGWHPAIATIRAERDARGALIRAFTVTGEDTLYREQLTWLSRQRPDFGVHAFARYRGGRELQRTDERDACRRRGQHGVLDRARKRRCGAAEADLRGHAEVFRAGIAALGSVSAGHKAEAALPAAALPSK